MPTSKFNLGQDVSVDLIDGITGQKLKIALVIDFKSSPVITKISSKPLNQPPLQFDQPDGWNFSFTIDRANSRADDAWAAIELAYWNGSIMQLSTMYQYVHEKNGSISTYEYNGVTYSLQDAGSWMQNQVVKQTISGFAQTRYKK